MIPLILNHFGEVLFSIAYAIAGVCTWGSLVFASGDLKVRDLFVIPVLAIVWPICILGIIYNATNFEYVLWRRK